MAGVEGGAGVFCCCVRRPGSSGAGRQTMRPESRCQLCRVHSGFILRCVIKLLRHLFPCPPPFHLLAASPPARSSKHFSFVQQFPHLVTFIVAELFFLLLFLLHLFLLSCLAKTEIMHSCCMNLCYSPFRQSDGLILCKSRKNIPLFFNKQEYRRAAVADIPVFSGCRAALGETKSCPSFFFPEWKQTISREQKQPDNKSSPSPSALWDAGRVTVFSAAVTIHCQCWKMHSHHGKLCRSRESCHFSRHRIKLDV